MLKRILVLLITFFIAAVATPETWSQSSKKKASETDPTIFSFPFSDWEGPKITVYGFIPKGVDAKTAPVLMMMHGNGRNSKSYMKAWAPLAQKHGVIVLAPNFDAKKFKGARRYNLGHVFTGKGKMRDEEKWTFSAIDPVFDYVTDKIGNTQSQYTLYGHSAGAQFVHRFMYYKPDAKVKRFLMGNAGWYTMPDMNEPFPYGLKGGHISDITLKTALGRDVVIFLGDRDTDTKHKSLRRTPEAMRQGEHRFARGHSFYDKGKQVAKTYDVSFGWQKEIVPGVAHSNRGIAKQAIKFVE